MVEKDKLLTSYFIKDSTFENSSLEFPSETALQEYDKGKPFNMHVYFIHKWVILKILEIWKNNIKKLTILCGILFLYERIFIVLELVFKILKMTVC